MYIYLYSSDCDTVGCTWWWCECSAMESFRGFVCHRGSWQKDQTVGSYKRYLHFCCMCAGILKLLWSQFSSNKIKIWNLFEFHSLYHIWVYNVYHLRLNFWSFFPRVYANSFMTGSVIQFCWKKSFIYLGKCECKGILTGSNAGIMALDFDLEVRFQPEIGIILLIDHNKILMWI